MRKGDIVLTPIGNALYGGIPSLVVDADKTGISVWTGKFLLKYEKKDLAAHGRVRKIKTYRTNKHNEFSQFKVNFGEEDFIVDVKISDFLFKRKGIMARSLNRVQLIGNLTRDPELRYTPQGTGVCTFGLATNRSWTTDTGDKKEEAEYHKIVAWNKLGELCSQLLSKGRKVYVEGRLSTRSWTGQDGVHVPDFRSGNRPVRRAAGQESERS